MQFLAPLFLAALAGLAIPVVLHFRRKQPKERVPFSAVQFLDPDRPITRRSRRLENLLLLALRCLGLALLALAFARPFLANPTLMAAAMSAEHLILVDASASMRGERFERARQAAQEILAGIPEDDHVAIATFAGAFSTALPFDHERPARDERIAALGAIRSLQPTWGATDLGLALTTAADVIDRARTSESSQAVIHVVSDFQRGALTEELADYDWPERLQVSPVRVSDADWTNAGIHPVARTHGSPNDFRATIVNASGSTNDDFELSWNGGPATAVSIRPGQNRVVTSRSSEGQATLGGDPFDFDNRAWFAARRPVALTVDYVGQARAEDAADTLFFLTRALQSTPEYTIDLRVRPPSGTPSLTILDGTRGTLLDLQSGHTTLLVLRTAGDIAALNALTGGNAKATEIASPEPALIGRIDFSDPVLAPFADPAFSNFSRIFIRRHRQLADIPEAAVLMRLDSGDPLLLRVSVGKGALYVLTTSWRPADSQLALSSKFAPLLHALLARSSDFQATGHEVSIGDPVTLPAGATEVRTPDGKTLPAPDGVFLATTEPGLYQTADGRFEFAVNPRPSETELAPLGDAQLASLGIPLGRPKATAAEDSTQRQVLAREELERQQKWWWWLILSAIAAFVVESLLAARTTRRRLAAATP